jgi:hypothetical protein
LVLVYPSPQAIIYANRTVVDVDYEEDPMMATQATAAKGEEGEDGERVKG